MVTFSKVTLEKLVFLKLRWTAQLGELGSVTRRSDRESLKHLITTRSVTVRKPYHRFDTIKPALASLIGTINNEAGFLTDPTGNRRFLVCRLTGIDWAYTHQIDPHQVWAEAVVLYKAGEPCLPTAVETRLQNAINQEYLVPMLSLRRSKPKDQGPTQLWFELSEPGSKVASGR